MKKTIVLLAVLIMAVHASAEILIIQGVTASSNDTWWLDNYGANNLAPAVVVGSGAFNESDQTAVATSHGGEQYLSQGYAFYQGPELNPQVPHVWGGSSWIPWDRLYLDFDLGGTYDLSEMHIWNGAQPTAGAEPGRGFRKVDISYSDDGGATYTDAYTGIILNSAFDLDPNLANGVAYSATDILDMSGIMADHVRITAYASFEGGNYSGDDTPTNPWDYPGCGHFQMHKVRFKADIAFDPYVPAQAGVPRNQVTLTASSEISPDNAQTVINHEGITDPQAFMHGNSAFGGGMWVSASGGGGYGFPADPALPAERSTGRAWLRFDFSSAKNLGIMSIWNSKQDTELDRCLKKIYIDYTEDGLTWNTLMNGSDDFFVLDRAWPVPTGPDADIDFDGAVAKSVVITADELEGNYGDASYWSLSEVRFGLDGVPWPGEPNYPSQDIILHDRIQVSIPADSESVEGEKDWLVNNLGLGDNFRHIATAYGNAMLMSDPAGPSAAVAGKTTVGQTWFRFDFDGVYTLGEMRIWNYNQIAFTDYTGRGVKNVIVQYTSDGVNWSTLGSYEIPQALAETESGPDAVIDFAGASASSVVITAADNWDGDIWYGLSQVEFVIDGTVFGYENADLESFAAQWLDAGSNNVNCPGWDLDGDCAVNLVDLSSFGKRWLLNGI